MEDVDGAVLYVGKAVNLRRRLACYAGRAPSLHRRLEALMTRAAHVVVREAPSDLEATLLEAQLVVEHAPLFNVARRVHLGSSYIRVGLTDDPPRVHLVGEAAADGARYVGPLRSARQAQHALAVARLAFPTAFGRRVEDVEARRSAVLGVAALLGGQKDAALAALREMMHAAAAAGDRAGVDRARDALRRVHDLSLEPSLLVGLRAHDRVLIVERLVDRQVTESGLRVHLLDGGRYVGSADVDVSAWFGQPDEARHVADAIAAENPSPAGFGRDDRCLSARPLDPLHEQTVIRRWLAMSKAVEGVYAV